MRTRRGARLALVAILALSAVILGSCAYGFWQAFGRSDPVGDRIGDLSDVPASAAGIGSVSAPFTFIITSDEHFGYGNGPRQAAMTGFASLAKTDNANFAVFGGDDADKGTEGEYQDFVTFTQTLKTGSGSQIPWFSAVGNHDLYNSGWKYFKQYVGPSFYRIVVGGLVSIYVLDTGNGTVGETQLERLQSAMPKDPNPKIVVTHYPIYGSSSYLYYRITNPRERIELLDLFARTNVKALFVGHWHYPDYTDCGPFYERVSGSLIDSDVDGKAHCWVVSVDGSGNVSAVRHDF